MRGLKRNLIQVRLLGWLMLAFVAFSPVASFAQNQCASYFTARKLTPAVRAYYAQQINKRFETQMVNDAMVKTIQDSIAPIAADPTSQRRENKVTAATVIVDAAKIKFRESLKALKESLKGSEDFADLNETDMVVTSRDGKVDGFVNVTITEYTQPFGMTVRQMIQAGFKVRKELLKDLDRVITLKIRKRRYGRVPEDKTSFDLKDVIYAEVSKDRVSIEFKFEDPSVELSVYKPQLSMSLADAALFGNRKAYLGRANAIRENVMDHLQLNGTKKLNAGSVGAMLNFIEQAQKQNFVLETVAINLYVRVGESVVLPYRSEKDPFYDQNLPKRDKVELQMTFDKLVSFFLPDIDHLYNDQVFQRLLNTYYKAYSKELTVSEFKVLTSVARHLTDAQANGKAQNEDFVGYKPTDEEVQNMARVLPGMTEFMQMMTEIVQHRDESKELDRGKWGTSIQEVRKSILRKLEDIH